jgi:hypothetical protein
LGRPSIQCLSYQSRVVLLWKYFSNDLFCLWRDLFLSLTTVRGSWAHEVRNKLENVEIFFYLIHNPQYFVDNRIEFKARVLFFCFNNHVVNVEPENVVRYVQFKRLGAPYFLTESNRDAWLLLLSRLGSLVYCPEIYREFGQYVTCHC